MTFLTWRQSYLRRFRSFFWSVALALILSLCLVLFFPFPFFSWLGASFQEDCGFGRFSPCIVFSPVFFPFQFRRSSTSEFSTMSPPSPWLPLAREFTAGGWAFSITFYVAWFLFFNPPFPTSPRVPPVIYTFPRHGFLEASPPTFPLPPFVTTLLVRAVL